MKLAVGIVLVASFAATVGSPVSVASADEPADRTTSEITIVPIPPIPTLDPTTLCSPVTVSPTPLPPEGDIRAYPGTANLSATCSYALTEVTGLANSGQFSLWVGTEEPTSFPPNPTQGEPLLWSATSEECAESYVSWDAFGYTPPRFIFNGVDVIEIPGSYQTITEGTTNAYWIASTGMCELDFGGGASRELYSTSASPYSSVTIGSKLVIGTASGPVAKPTYTYLVHE